MNFSNCPRCYGNFTYIKETKKCYKCSLSYRQYVNDTRSYSLDFFSFQKFLGIEGFNLYWAVENNEPSYCQYGNTPHSIKLPRLPFDITPEQLKLYLTFY